MAGNAFIIRRASEEDACAIKEIMQESFGKYIKDAGLPATLEALNESCEDIVSDIKNKYVFVAVMGPEAIGSVRVEILPDNTAYIMRFGVRIAYQNIGVGKSLMSAVDQLLTSKGVKKAYLHTASKNFDLVRFYYGMGFYVDSTSKDRGYVRALMVKEY